MDRLKDIWVIVLLVLLCPLLIPLFLLVVVLLLWHLLVWLLLWGTILRIWFWRAHATRGRPILFIYSESPNWQDYIEANILPKICDRSIILNWSRRRHWNSESFWEACFFRRFAGEYHYNPLALVFGPRGSIRAIRFHQAFLDLKHAKPSTLQAVESEFFSLVEAIQ